MNTNKKIEARRLELGLSENQLAGAIGISLDSYCDIEWHADEIFTAVELRLIKKLAETLDIESFELLSLQCPFCSNETAYIEEYRLPRNALIRTIRQKMGISQQELGQRSAFHDYAIEGMERDPDYLERSTVDSIMDLAKALKIPFQILSSTKCPKCSG
jgi:transcriptional regulator with XRE-family HTH domain